MQTTKEMLMNKSKFRRPDAMDRRGFLKGLLAAGAAAALPGGLLTARNATAAPFDPVRIRYSATPARETAMIPAA